MRRKEPENVHQCNNRASETTSGDTENIGSHQGTREDDECYMDGQSTDVTQSTSRLTEAELHKTKQPAPYQTVWQFFILLMLQKYYTLTFICKMYILSQKLKTIIYANMLLPDFGENLVLFVFF